MIESTGKRKKRHLDHPKYRFKLTCLFHGPGNLSDECKVLGDFGSKYSKIRPTKDSGHKTTFKKNVRKKENNSIVQHAVDEIL